MSMGQHQRVQQLFDEACRLDGQAREEYLDRACEGDTALRAEVVSLLRFDAHGGDDLGGHEAGMGWHLLMDASADLKHRSTPTRIGRYTIIRRIGAGGMGVVYEAREDHSGRTAALKMLHSGEASTASHARFERELRVLGRLHHVGIAQLYGAGTADLGHGEQAYFVMEMVRGRTLLDHCRDLPTREKLRLFTLVCDAVEYAHGEQIVHRDLKPGNILVDEHGQPKVLDFGVARDNATTTMGSSVHTSAGHLVGTLAYMSPEQVAADPQKVDTTATSMRSELSCTSC